MKLKPESTNKTHETWFDYIWKDIATNMERSPNITWYAAKNTVVQYGADDSDSDNDLVE